MAKKNRATEPGQSTFDRAKAAFDRVGEDYAPASKAVELSGTEEPVKTPDNAATPEVPIDDTDSAEPVPETDADPEPVAAPDSAGTETNAPDADTSESAATPDTETAETPETSEPDDSDATPVDSDVTPDNDSAAPETDDDSDVPESESEAVADESDEAEEPEDESDSFWTFDADEPEAEVTEMEKLTMETKEITLGVHHSPPPEVNAEPREQEKKSKPRFKAFEELKDAFRVRADNTDDTPSASSSRDAAIRKRVMQIEDEETRNYLLDRVLPQMAWYSKKSAQYQTMYYRLMAATILMGALIPAFSVGANNTTVKVILALLGASVTGINAYLALHNYHDLWVSYRTTREDLIHHLYCYFNKAGVFSSSEDLDVLLVNICEDTLSKENGGWTTIIQKT